ncbi:MAG: serine/threonine protein kinase [Roseburia sp.]|nr:serine/threonine protein kinase [Roseburia sp.]
MDIISKIWPQWETVELIGSGSFGKVYKARRRELGNEYFSAIKIMRIPSDQSEIKDLQRSGMDAGSIHSYYEDMIRNLLNEIQIMESLKSANNIVGIEDHQVVKLEEGIGWEIYIRMELLTDLGSYLEQNTMSIDKVVQLGMDVCRALIACEKVNIIHRDIKIDNVFVNEFGSFKLGDFGISKQLEKTQSALSQKGTNMYMAPEVFRGEHYDQTVDIYSLGIMMYRLANDGRFPFMPPVTQPLQFNDTQRALEKRLTGEPLPEPHNADVELSQIIRKACEYRSKDRYQSAEELAKALQQYSYNRAASRVVAGGSHAAPEIQPIQSEKIEDDRTYAAFSVASTENSKATSNEKQSYSDAPEWSLGGNPTVAAALDVINELDSDKKKAVKAPELVKAEPKEEKKTEKEIPKVTKKKKRHAGIFVGIGAAVLVLGIVATLYFFIGNPFANKENSVAEDKRTTVEKIGVSLQFPDGWEVKKSEDSAWAYKEDAENTHMGVHIRYTVGFDKEDENGMTKEMADELADSFMHLFDVKESSLYEIQGRNYWHVTFAYDGEEQSRYVTNQDTRCLEFTMIKKGTITQEEEELFQQVMKSVQLDFDGIDYSELRPADADDEPFALGEEQTKAQGLGISLKLPTVCKITADEENRLSAEYSGGTYTDAYKLQIAKKDVSALGYIDNGINEATAQKILDIEEKESGHAVEKYLYENVGGRDYLYIRATDSKKLYATMVTIIDGTQYSFRFDSEEYSSLYAQEIKAFLCEMIATVVYP